MSTLAWLFYAKVTLTIMVLIYIRFILTACHPIWGYFTLLFLIFYLCRSPVVYCTRTWMLFTCVELHVEVNISWAWGREDYMRIVEHPGVQVVESIPWAVIGCQPSSGYASMHIYWLAHWHILVCKLDTSWAAESLNVIISSCASGQWLLQS